MKKLSIILCLVFSAGCASNSPATLSQNQVHIGMKVMDIWKLYGFQPGAGNSELIPQFAIQPLSEQENNECEISIYRYWLTQDGSKLPFLLTFQSCRLPNYDTVQKEKERRIDRLKEAAINDPDLKKELDTFCEENKLDSKNKELLIELLVTNNDQPLLPQCMTDWTLIAIKLDKNYKGAKKSGGSNYTSIKSSGSDDLQIDAYGPGVHSNRYGQPVRLWPDFGGVPGEYLQIKPNAYGPGVHMDQYGRPVREYPWP